MFDPTRKYELRVRPLGRTQADEYYHNDATWIEGRDGNTYTVDISNHTPGRVLFIVSVDGLDVIEGKTAGVNSNGYVLEPNSTLSIPGWKLNNKEAAEFYFSRGQDSYVNSIGGSTSNTGVIGALAFPEYVAPVTTQNWDHWKSLTGTAVPYPYGQLMNVNTSDFSGSWSTAKGMMGPQGAVGPAGVRGIMQNAVSTTYSATSPVTQEVGTGFGEATEWATTSVNFVRANHYEPDGFLAVYYNTAKNLEKMGIRLRRKNNPGYTANPFPGYTSSPSAGCPVPPGWNGKRR